MLGIAIIGRADVGEGVAEVTGLLVEIGDGVLDRLGIEPVAGVQLQVCLMVETGKSRSALSASILPNL